MQVKTGYESGKYAFIIMGHRRWVWDNKNAHVCPETAHSAIMRIDQHRPVGGLGVFAATGASLGKIKPLVRTAYMRKSPVAGAMKTSVEIFNYRRKHGFGFRRFWSNIPSPVRVHRFCMFKVMKIQFTDSALANSEFAWLIKVHH